MKKVLVLGGAGLVGQNLVPLLADGFEVCVVDKGANNLQILKKINPGVKILVEDLAEPGQWQDQIIHADFVVSLNAQISSLEEGDFHRNNVKATETILAELAKKNPNLHIIHVSSSVVNSLAVDAYSSTKRMQEQLVANSGIPATILRPTLMFGPLDRKHLGWLSRFLRVSPIFPIPGSGEFQRQPLFVQDFCQIIRSILINGGPQGTFDISGRHLFTYIELIRKLKSATGSKALLIKIPFVLFDFLLKAAARVMRNPPFTSQQLHALVIPEVFPIIDWPAIFQVKETELELAFEKSFANRHPLEEKLDF